MSTNLHAQESADARVCDAEQRAMSEGRHATRIVRAERQVTSTRIAAQARHVKSREFRLFKAYSEVHAKENVHLQTAADVKESLVSLKSRTASFTESERVLHNQSSKAVARAQSMCSDLDDAKEELASTLEKILLCEQQRKANNETSQKRIDSLNRLLMSANQHIDKLKLQLPKIIKKVPRPQGGLEWDEKVTQMCMEMHTHRTPPRIHCCQYRISVCHHLT